MTPLPVYTELERQWRFMNAPGKPIWQLKVPQSTLLPFFINSTVAANLELTEVKLIELDGNNEYVIPLNIFNAKVEKSDQFFTFKGLQDTTNIPTLVGICYLELTIGTFKFYTECFSFSPKDTSLIKISCSNTNAPDGLRVVDLSLPKDYKPFMYLDGVIGMPLYNFTVENEERFGYQYPIAESFNKIYQITGAVPEYILDFLAFFVISENKGVSQYKRFFTCNKAELDIEWQTGGYMAGFTLKLTVYGGYKQVFIASGSGGSFNNTDFNNDFD